VVVVVGLLHTGFVVVVGVVVALAVPLAVPFCATGADASGTSVLSIAGFAVVPLSAWSISGAAVVPALTSVEAFASPVAVTLELPSLLLPCACSLLLLLLGSCVGAPVVAAWLVVLVFVGTTLELPALLSVPALAVVEVFGLVRFSASVKGTRAKQKHTKAVRRERRRPNLRQTMRIAAQQDERC